MKSFMVIVIFGNLFCSVLSLKCYECSSPGDCHRRRLIECNYDAVRSTGAHLSFLPGAQSQSSSNNYNCATYRGTFLNSSAFEVAGCFYSTYNVCDETNNVIVQKWVCDHCSGRDGCNPASRTISSGLAISLLLMLVAFMFK